MSAAAPGLVDAAFAAAVARRREDADEDAGRQPSDATRVAASRCRAVALALLRDAADLLRAVRRAVSTCIHAGDEAMTVHFAALRWGARPLSLPPAPAPEAEPSPRSPRAFFGEVG